MRWLSFRCSWVRLCWVQLTGSTCLIWPCLAAGVAVGWLRTKGMGYG